ncbi:MAG: multidrug effflux MFS transporter [Proteobacteria bacterium]|nr:multidrug effflux MFS transporter [Burkholderiales bacterium]
MLAGLATIGPFSIDTYLPSFPAIADDYGVSALYVQQTLSIYLASFAVMSLFHGALSDSFGRRPVILVSLVVFVVASIGCTFAPSIGTLLACRALQGMSAGAGMVVGRAIIRDTYDGPQAQRLMAQVTMIFSLAPAIAPVVGGLLDQAFGWKSIFVFLTVFGVLLWAGCAWHLPETLARSDRQPFRAAPLFASYLKVCGSLRFAMLAFAVSLNFAGFFVYIVSAPVVVYQHLGLSGTEFAWLFVPGIGGVMIGAWLSGRLAGRTTPERTIALGYAILAIAATTSLVYHALFPPAIPWSVLPIMVYTIGMALAMPSITLLALDMFPRNRGMVSSVQGFTQSTTNAVLAGVVAPLVSFSQLSLAIAAAVFLAIGAACWCAYLKLSQGMAPAVEAVGREAASTE